MPRHATPSAAANNAVSTENLSGALKAVRLEIEREKLSLLKAKTAKLAPQQKGDSLNQRLKGYAPSAKELERLKNELAERQARMALNDRRYFEYMLTHRRENGCNDIALLEAELQLQYAAQAQRIKEGQNAYGEPRP